MLIKVLGSAAGGGVPQWNCNYTYSRLARGGDPHLPVRLQSSIAATAGAGWVLFNASPDIRQQIAQTSALQPSGTDILRSTPIQAVVLTNADVDHIGGLLSLRERQRLFLYGTARVLAVLDQNPIFRVLDPAYVERIELPVGKRVAIQGPQGDTGLHVELYPVPGKVALYLESGEAGRDFNADAGDTVGAAIGSSCSAAILHYVPGCADVTEDLCKRLDRADALLFDGTVFTDAEMAEAGVGTKTGRRMGHMPISGADGSLHALRDITIGRRIYIHINNTNPLLDSRSAARSAVEAAGWEVAFDGMDIEL